MSSPAPRVPAARALSYSLLPLLLLGVAACAPSETDDGRPSLSVALSPAAVLADGAEQVTVTVTGTRSDGTPLTGPILLTATRGTFAETGNRSMSGTLAAGTFTTALDTCDSRTEAGCAGTAEVTAQQGAVTAKASVVFRTLELDCENGVDDDGDGDTDCADADCEGVALTDGAVCAGGVWSCPGGLAEDLCGDGVDNDCDGVLDCDDDDCQGQACDEHGSVCDGTCVCLVAGGPGTEPGLEGVGGDDCRDGLDNDCDGAVDGDDVDCMGRACDDAGNRWTETGCACVPEQATEAACGDGFDNDCDGVADCADPDCGGAACTDPALAPNDQGLTCDASAGLCACASDPEGDGIEQNCSDTSDEDCDGLVDCADLANCADQLCGAHGQRCQGGLCVCPGGDVELDCSNDADDDCDGLIDCADPDCDAEGCGEFGLTCADDACTCPGGTVEGLCGNGLDDDCDGLSDCRDPDCDALACQTDYICDFGQEACVLDPGTDLVQLSADRARVLADDASVVLLTAVVSNRLGPVAAADVTFDVAAGGLDEAFGAASWTTTTDAAGAATATWRPGEVPAKDLTATATVAGGGDTATADIQVIGLSTIEVRSIQYTTMGVRESGYQESNLLEFRVLGTDGVTTNLVVPDGTPVSFDTGDNTAGGLYLTKNADTTAGGVVTTTAKSGTVATTFAVTASAAIGGVTSTVTTQSIAIIGAKATQRGFTFQCASWNVGALLNADLTNSNAAIDVDCTVSLKDRFTNPIALPTAVSFAAEAGTIDTPRDTADRGTVGGATTRFHTFGVLPQDVPPIPGEPYWVWTDNVNSQRYVKNPRDGLVTLIAFTNGEEEFVDGNGNGTYDAGDFLFVDANGNDAWDAPESYTDSNGNGLYDPGEPFTDTNGNGTWDRGEDLGDLDGDCRYDPAPEPFLDGNVDGVFDAVIANGSFDPGESYWDRDGDCSRDAGEDYVDLDGDGVWTAGEQFTDLNGDGVWNEGDVYVDLNSDCSWTPEEPYVDADGDGIWDAAESYTDSDGDGAWDPAETLTYDANGNGVYDEADGDTFEDADNDGTWDPAEPFVDANGDGTWTDEEPYTDVNGDGAWTAEEPYTDADGNGTFDAPEPFVDLNRNGTRDPGDPFTDADGDGVYDAPEPFYDFGHDRIPNTLDVGEGDGVFTAGEDFTDLDGDCRWDPGDDFVDLDGDGRYERGEFFVDLAEPFLDANDNSTWDPGEFFKDVNQNGRWNGPNCRWDRNTQIWTQTRMVETGGSSVLGGRDPGPTPDGFWASGFHAYGDGVPPEICVPNGGSTTVGLQITDENLNLPRGGTTTTLKKVSGNVTPKFTHTGTGSAGLIDALGMDWGLATDCRGRVCSCTSDYCTVRSYLRSFSGGARYGVMIEDSAKTDKDPPAGFSVSATFSGCPQPCVYGASGSAD